MLAESSLGPFLSRKGQYPPVAKNRLHIIPRQGEVNAGKRYGSIRLQKNEFCNMTVKKQETEVITPVSEALDDELRFVMVQI